MRTQRDFLLFVAVVTVAAMPATMPTLAQTPSATEPASSEKHNAASIPNFSGTWTSRMVWSVAPGS